MPFEAPSVAPTTDEEEMAFMKLDSIISSGELASAIGWAIGCGCHLAQKRSDILDMCHKLKGAFSGRVLKNWAQYFFSGPGKGRYDCHICQCLLVITCSFCWKLST